MLTLPRETGSGFAVELSAIEWDSATNADARMNDRSKQAEHFYQDGRFTNAIGTQTVELGESGCRVALEYSLAVE